MSDEVQPEILADDSDKKTERIRNLGDYGINGGPGRPKGAINKFTQFKHDIIDLWQEEDCKEKLRMFLKHPKTFFKVVDTMVAILPKDEPEVLKPKSISVVVIKQGDNGTTNVHHSERGPEQAGNSLEAQASGLLRKQSA